MKLTLEQASILQAISEGIRSPPEIAARLGITPDELRPKIIDMLNSGLIEINLRDTKKCAIDYLKGSK